MKCRLIVLVVTFIALQAGAADNTPESAVKVKSSDNLISEPQLADIKHLIESGDYRGAVTRLKLLSQSSKEDPEIWRLLGIAALGKGDYLGSKVAFEKSLMLDPENSQTLSLQAELFINMGDRKSARSNLDKLELICPNGCEAREQLAAALELL